MPHTSPAQSAPDVRLSMPGLTAGVVVVIVLAVSITLNLLRSASRSDVQAKTQVGEVYEQHVFDPSRLPARVEAFGGTLKTHARLPVPNQSCSASLYGQPGGWDGPLTHVLGSEFWPAHGPGGYRVPDGLITWKSQPQTLVELKCSSPWLVFSGNEPWARQMQDAFGSQACGYIRWAQQTGGQIEYGFCGLVPPWADRILRGLSSRYRVPIRIREGFFADDFPPAQRLKHAQREPQTLADAVAYDRGHD